MELYEFLQILDGELGSSIEKDEERKTKPELQRIQGIFQMFFLSDSKDDKPLVLDGKSQSLARKIWNGTPISGADAKFINGMVCGEAFDDFWTEKQFPDSTKESLIKKFSNKGVKISEDNFPNDLAQALKDILNEIVRRDEKPSLLKAVYVDDGYVVLTNKKRCRLPEELKCPQSLGNDEKYAIALLEVYAQDAKSPKIDVSDLDTKPIYKTSFTMSRNDYFKAVNASRQIRDVFSDGETMIDDTKKQAFSIIQNTLTQGWKNAFERLQKTMDIVIEASLYSKDSLGREGYGFCDASMKRGIVHMLVNDGKVKWIVSYDTDI
jgi:hypothetical protein